jgi:hypothetical protein
MSGSPPRPRAWRCAGTQAVRGWWSAPRDGSSSAVARTCARAAVGLLADPHPEAAYRLALTLLDPGA